MPPRRSNSRKTNNSKGETSQDGSRYSALCFNGIVLGSLVGLVLYRLGPEMTQGKEDYFRTKRGTSSPHDTTSLSTTNVTVATAEEESWPYFVDEDNMAYCQTNNFVRNRLDGYVRQNGVEEHRPYSISPKTFSALDHHPKMCASIDETLHAISAGTRHWMLPVLSNHTNDTDTTADTKASLLREQLPSYFVPDQCSLPALSPHELCDSMDAYSHVITVGDSLTRHLRQAFFMALSNNWVGGGMVRPNARVNLRDFYSCRCDGQFSEHVSCRSFDQLFNVVNEPGQVHMCQHLPLDDPNRPRFRFYHDWKEDALLQQQCNSTDPNFRGILLILQGGAHHNNNAQAFAQSILEPLFQKPSFQTCLEHHRIDILWTTSNAQSHTLDARYPHQNRTNMQAFNRDMQAYFNAKPFPVHTMDVHALTMDAQSSDGFHYLSDVNLLKVYFIVHIANRIRQERRHAAELLLQPQQPQNQSLLVVQPAP